MPMDTSPTLWANRQRPLGDEEKLLRQCKLGELCWLAAASRPDVCARLAHVTSRANKLRGSDIYCINDLIKTVIIWQPRAVLKYASSTKPLFPPEGRALGRFRVRGERIHKGAMTLVGWSNAAYGVWRRGDVGGGATAVEIHHWTYGVVSLGPLPCSAVDLEVHSETSQE